MKLLTRFILLLFTYTEKIIKLYKPHVIRRKDYINLRKNLFEASQNCSDYCETQ